MGARGRPPKPTALRLLHGETDKRRLNPDEPTPPDEIVVRPDWLSPPAAEEWDRLAPHLISMGVLTVVDLMMFAVYCETAATARRLNQARATTAPVMREPDRNGRHPRNPIYAQCRDVNDQLRILAREFGFTPSARSGIRVEHHVVGGAERLLS